MSTASNAIGLFRRAAERSASTAIISGGRRYTYGELLAASERLAAMLLGDTDDLREGRVAYLVPPGFQYVATQWAIWRAGGIAVPLAEQHPRPELEYVVDDCRPVRMIASQDRCDRLREIASTRGVPLLDSQTDDASSGGRNLPELVDSRRALILYTSGTTGKPKGVVTTHANIDAQTRSLIEAWDWTEDDRILSVLPLHHIHGIINVVTCALYSGATCEFLPKFDAHEVWRKLSAGELTLFMAVPTIYSRLIAAWEESSTPAQSDMSAGCRKLRLMVSGSAALPVPTLETWQRISGHTLLERYGMTEIGMALSNPLHGNRSPGHVGTPLPGVEVRRRDEAGGVIADDVPGEIQVRGPGVFGEYWQRPDETAKAFTDGWFHTGDVAVVDNNRYRILGRNSVDIIKTGGYKVSALEIEDALRGHPNVADSAVVGVADREWGEVVSACIVLQSPETELDLSSLRDWCRDKIASYKIPQRLLIVEDFPRNAMGKVQKPRIVEQFQSAE